MGDVGVHNGSARIYQRSASCLTELGFRVTPLVDGKRPFLKDWWNLALAQDNTEAAEAHGRAFSDSYNVGAAVGYEVLPGKQLIAFDYDYIGYLKKDEQALSDDELQEAAIGAHEAGQHIWSLLPRTPLLKKGEKGFTAFYLVDVDNEGEIASCSIAGVVDILSTGKQTVLPPSIHPKTRKPYYWLDEDTFEPLPEPMPPAHLTEAGTITRAELEAVLAFCSKLHGQLIRAPISDEAAAQHARQKIQGAAQSHKAGSRLINDAARRQMDKWLPELVHNWPKYQVSSRIQIDDERHDDKWEVVNMLRVSGQGRQPSARKANLQPWRQLLMAPDGSRASIRDHSAGGTVYSPVAFVMGALCWNNRQCPKEVDRVLRDCKAAVIREAEDWLLERIDLKPPMPDRPVGTFTARWRSLEPVRSTYDNLKLEGLNPIETGWDDLSAPDIARGVYIPQFVGSFFDAARLKDLARRTRSITNKDVIAARKRHGSHFDAMMEERPFRPPVTNQAVWSRDRDILVADRLGLKFKSISEHAPVHGLAITVGGGKTYNAIKRSVWEVITAMTDDFFRERSRDGDIATNRPSMRINFYFRESNLKDEKWRECGNEYQRQLKGWLAGPGPASLSTRYGFHFGDRSWQQELAEWLDVEKRVQAYSGVEPHCLSSVTKFLDGRLQLEKDDEQHYAGKLDYEDLAYRRSHARSEGLSNDQFCGACPIRRAGSCSYWAQDLSAAAIICMPHSMLVNPLSDKLRPVGSHVWTDIIDEDCQTTFYKSTDLREPNLIGPRSLGHQNIARLFSPGYQIQPRDLLKAILEGDPWRDLIDKHALQKTITGLRHVEIEEEARKRLYGRQYARKIWIRIREKEAEPELANEENQSPKRYPVISTPHLRNTISFFEAVYREIASDQLEPWEQRCLPVGSFNFIKRAKTEAGQKGLEIKDTETGDTKVNGYDALPMVTFGFRDQCRDPKIEIERAKAVYDAMHRIETRRKNKSCRDGKTYSEASSLAKIFVPPNYPRFGTPIMLLNATANEKELEHTFGRQPDWDPALTSFTQIRIALPETARIFTDVSNCHHTRTSYGIGLTEGSSEEKKRKAMRMKQRISVLAYYLTSKSGKTLVVGPKALNGKIALPPGAVWRDNGKITGTNSFNAFQYVIIISANEPACEELERLAEAVIGRPVQRRDHGFHSSVPCHSRQKQFGKLIEVDGRKHHLQHMREHVHEDPDVEAIRDRHTDAVTEQAWGRLRAVLAQSGDVKAAFLMSATETREPPTHTFNSDGLDQIRPSEFMMIAGFWLDLTTRGAYSVLCALAPEFFPNRDMARKREKEGKRAIFPDLSDYKENDPETSIDRTAWPGLQASAQMANENRTSRPGPITDLKNDPSGLKLWVRPTAAAFHGEGKPMRRHSVLVVFKNEVARDHWLRRGSVETVVPTKKRRALVSRSPGGTR